MLNGQPIIQRFICCLILFKVWLKQNFFYKKDFDYSYHPIYPTIFCWLLQFLLLAMIKIQEQQALNTTIHFYFCFQTFLCILTITSSRYFVYQLPGKVENSTFSTQICPKMDIGLEFQKTNLRIRITILTILCVSIFRQNRQL